MPSREEEFSAGLKGARGKALCPFCGSPNVYYNKQFRSWRCGGCEKSFPTPSYGARGKPSWLDRLFGRG